MGVSRIIFELDSRAWAVSPKVTAGPALAGSGAGESGSTSLNGPSTWNRR
jgi:hypothetical protein